MTKFVTVNNGWIYLSMKNLNIFVNSDFNKAFDIFWSEVNKDFERAKVIGLYLKIKDNEGNFRSLGPLFKFTKSDKLLLRRVLLEYINLKGNNYSTINISSIIFQYIILDNKTEISIPSASPKKADSYYFGNYSLPLTTNLEEWGKVSKVGEHLLIKSDKYESDIWVSVYKDRRVYEFIIDEKTILKVVDYFGVDNINFTRVIGNETFIIKNGEIVFKTKEKSCKFISKIAKDKVSSNNYLTLDIETRVINNVHSPYCISFYDGAKAWSFYLSDFNSIDDLLNNALSSIMRAKYDGWCIYVHNGSGFDYIFLLKYLSLLGDIDPLIKDGKFFNLKLSWKKGNRTYSINFRDSLLLLPSPLRKLAKAFNVENKGFFPFYFINNFTVPLDYIGPIPNFSYYDGISKDDYQNLISDTWNLREEAIKYCELDCKVLYQIIYKFNKLIFEKFSLNVHRFPTLSSLAFAIFRSSYLGNHKIPKLGGHIFDFIKEGYTGGRVDVFIPYGKDLYYYDVNSLYPTVYSTNPMPVGTPKWFLGNILEREPDAFGFFRCKITAPDDLKIPVLQTHVKTPNGIRTMAPLGTWNDVLFSEEAKLAMTYGYKIEVIEGYTFSRAIIFDQYAQDMFQIKQSHDSSHPMYLISKLLLNSLYGKFGMSIDLLKYLIIDNTKIADFLVKNSLVSEDDLGNGKSLISLKEDRDNDKINMNVSIGIAAAITAYARMHMTQYLQNKNYNVYYTDTDSIVTDSPIDSSHIGKALGQLKMEYKISKGLFLAPKVYSIITEAGDKITKIKGLKDNNLSFELLETLLDLNSRTKVKNEKWFRNLNNGDIKIKNQTYKLQATENKRRFIYKNNKRIGTTPFVINNNKEIV